ncbi:competence type IV pilus major pilin ComGC [Streptococcus loxodontisalivarius]|uniref:Competence protein ComGC n=1 Tax=Streptococcus loxodontisalivarius TaxID=1349415 RepID=A0ABS2PTJ8_9STRE|nr:competence type IV pilus major pilin ComGC [Streptococcus loxodontisalivarius]MBM7643378.1 competence protein ComGC [Streptococcus loxodontisalivarius]
MTKWLLKLKKATVKGFTLAEMLVVLLIISVLMLLFIPNLSKQKEAIQDKGNAAVVKVVESQAEVYELNHDDEATLSKLVSADQITAKQQKAYQDYYAKNKSGETAQVAN